MTGQRLAGGPGDEALFAEAGRIAADESFPIDDFRAYAAYRKKVVETLVKRALEQAIARFARDPRRTQ
jgi:CO/xanthine dehydrogenase FAD-binding subunit